MDFISELSPEETFRVSDKGAASRVLLGAFYRDPKYYKEGKLFYNSKRPYGMEDIFLESYGRVYKSENWRKTPIRLEGLLREMLGTDLIEFEYPYLWEGIDITLNFGNNIITGWAIKNNFMDDQMYLFFKWLILDNFRVVYKKSENQIWLVIKDKASIAKVSTSELFQRERDQGYTNTKIWDPRRGRGYTHILRRNLKLTLQQWQIDLLYNWRQYNFIAWSRRIGKTYLSAFLAYREIYRSWSWYGDRNRQILYVCVSEEKMWQPLQYIQSMFQKDMDAWFIKKRRNEFENTITGTVLKFTTAGSRSGARSFGADLVIIDEAAEIADEYWLDLLPIITQEQATVYAISTINEWSQNGWFYKELVRGETNPWDQYNTIRVTIDDNELLDDRAKEETKQKILDASPMKYWTELYCVFPNSQNVFKMSWVVQPPKDERPSNIIIGYDPWKINDSAAVIVVDMKQFRVIAEYEFNEMSYFNQKDELAKIKEKYQWTVIMDRTWVGEAVWEILSDVVNLSVKYKKSWSNINYDQKWNYYNVPKKDLIEFAQVLLDFRWLCINFDLEGLISQMKQFKQYTNNRGTMIYQGDGVKDDLVNAFLLCCFYISYIKVLDGANQIDEHIPWSWDILNNFNWLVFDDTYNEDIFKKYIY